MSTRDPYGGRMDDALEIFCDESGYTGPDLLHNQQPHFTYSGVALSTGEAREIIARIRRDHLLADPELKATDLVASEPGRRALMDVLRAVEGRFVFVLFHKRLGLCGKVFEYLYEPVFLDGVKLLYERNLHRFVTMYGFMAHQAGDPFTTEALRQFQAFMRSREVGDAPLLFSEAALTDESPFSSITRFARGYRDRILADLRAGPRAKDPALDLGASGLWSILTKFGERGRALAVTCDNSDLTQAVAARLSGGSDDLGIRRARSLLSNPEISEYDLARPIIFADSKASAGLQIADLIAGVATATVNGRIPRGMFEAVADLLDPACHHGHSVMPEPKWVDTSDRDPMVNWLILMELTVRADEGADPRLGLERKYWEFEVAWARGDLSQFASR